MTGEIFKQLMVNNFDTRIDLRDIRLLKSAFGSEGVKYFFNNIRGRSQTNEGIAKTIDDIFFVNLSGETNSVFTQEKFITALKKANETHQYIVDKLSLPKWDVGLLNDVIAFSESPFKRLDLLSSKNISSLLRFQLAEQLMLGLIHIHLDNRTKGKKLRTQLSQFVEFTNKEIISSDIRGQTEVKYIYSTHDHQNRVNRIGFSPFVSKYRNEHQKMTPLRLRKINLYGKSYTVVFDIRKKDDSIGALKSLEKAIHVNNGDIRIEDDVEDIIGTKFVVVEGNVKDFISAFETKVKEKYKDIRIEIDDNVNEDNRRQSKRHTFKRRQICLNNCKLEVIFYSLREFLNSEYDIGEKDEKGFYNGAAHSIYEIGRITHSGGHLIPKELYGLDVEDYGRKAQEIEAVKLLNYNDI